MRLALVVLATLVVGCGRATSTEDAASVTKSSQALEVLVNAHTSPTNVPASCAEEMTSYRASAAELLASMSSRCPGLDQCMQGLGHASEADLVRATTDLSTELEAHAAKGCGAADMTAELARHRGVMLGHCRHLRTRLGSMSGVGMTRGGRCR